MIIDFSDPGNVTFTMIDYIHKMLEGIPEDMKGETVSSAAHHLFTVNEDDPILLCEKDAIMFHHNTAKLLFLSKRAHPDIQLAVAFLCTRVQNPDTDDYKKLAKVMKYLESTIGLPLILAMDEKKVVEWYVDAAFAVHNDMKSMDHAMTVWKKQCDCIPKSYCHE